MGLLWRQGPETKNNNNNNKNQQKQQASEISVDAKYKNRGMTFKK
jgi:hypothetical protein